METVTGEVDGERGTRSGPRKGEGKGEKSAQRLLTPCVKEDKRPPAGGRYSPKLAMA